MSWSDVQPWWNGLAPVITLILGYAGTMVTESKRSARARAALRADRAATRQQEAEDRRRDFELAKLLEVDAALNALGRAAQQYRQDASEENAQAALAASRHLAAATGYVLREDIRITLETARQIAVGPASARARELDNTQMLDAFRTAREAIRERVRAIYEESVTTS